MFPKSTTALLAAANIFASTVFAAGDSAGYILPSSGTASTTQFILGTELASGTACGVDALPGGVSTSGGQGGGPGFLYAAINQLAFGANPSAGAGGPGGACGICYEITPVSGAGEALTSQALTFMIVDECPASVALSGGSHCNTCSLSETNDFGQTFHFDIAVDAMSSEQYSTFFNGVTDGSNWNEVQFQQTSCSSSTNPTPSIASFGCISDCSNNDAAGVCVDTGFSKF